MTGRLLSDLLKNLKYSEMHNYSQTMVSDVANDSRCVVPGSLFIAVKGYDDDGHKYVEDAINRGAVAIVCEKHCPTLEVPQVVVSDARLIQSRIACEFFNHPSREMHVVGVTGTNGKTTSTHMIDSIIHAAGFESGLMGTLYNKFGQRLLPTRNTTPDSILCQRLLREMADEGIRYVTMEVSSHAMVMHRVEGMHFNVGAITNISPEHLDLHKSMEEYMSAKRQFFRMLTKNDIAVANGDDEQAKCVATAVSNMITYGIEDYNSDVKVATTTSTAKGTIVKVAVRKGLTAITGRQIKPQELSFTLSVPGKHNIYNALLSLSVCLAMGIEERVVCRSLSEFRGIFRRYEVVYDKEFRVVDDATHNPGNMEAVFKTIEADGSGGIVVVYAVRGSRGVSINEGIAQTLNRWTERLAPKKLIVTRCSDTAGVLDAVIDEEEQVYRQIMRGKHNVEYTNTLRVAVQKAIDAIDVGDTMLLLGAHPMDNVSQVFSEEFGEELSILPRPPKFGI